MLIKSLFVISLIASAVACNNTKCPCELPYSPKGVYQPGDCVWYHDTCWITRNASGRGITPGPFGEGENDIWTVCND